MKRWRINWRPLAVLAVVIGGLAFIAPVAALAVFALVLLMLVVEAAGMGGFTTGGIGDDTLPVLNPEHGKPKRKRPFW
jgi:hypothetical protein